MREPGITPPARIGVTLANAVGFSGNVMIGLIVDTEGVPQDLVVLKTADPNLNRGALDAVREWRYRPAMKDGKPVAVQTVAGAVTAFAPTGLLPTGFGIPNNLPTPPPGVYRQGDPGVTRAIRQGNGFGPLPPSIAKPGRIMVAFVVSEKGIPGDFQFVESGGKDLDKAVAEMIGKWRYDPAIKDGKPVPFQTSFNLTIGSGAATSGTPPTPFPTQPPQLSSAPRPAAPISTEPLPEGVYRAGGDVNSPTAIFKIDAGYPDQARSAGLSGTVVVRAIVGVDGVAREFKVVRAVAPVLDQKALETARLWRFRAGDKDGVPVPVEVLMEFAFGSGTQPLPVQAPVTSPVTAPPPPPSAKAPKDPPYDPAFDAGPVYPIGAGVTAPTIIYKTEPSYTNEAREKKLSGNVNLSLIVNAAGQPKEIQVTRTLGMGLDEKAVEAVSKWRFKPGMKDGVPVRVRVTIFVAFQIQ
jgi:TonB family protein